MTPSADMRAYLTASRDIVRQRVEAVPSIHRRDAPSPGAWSAVEVLEHLANVERGIGKLLERRVPRAAPSVEDVTVDVDAIVRRLEAVGDRTDRAEAPERVKPAGDVSEAEVWAALDVTRQALLEGIESLAGRDGTTISVPHAVLGPLNLYEWIVFVGAHERRHAEQLREIGAHFARAGRA